MSPAHPAEATWDWTAKNSVYGEFLLTRLIAVLYYDPGSTGGGQEFASSSSSEKARAGRSQESDTSPGASCQDQRAKETPGDRSQSGDQHLQPAPIRSKHVITIILQKSASKWSLHVSAELVKF